MLDDNEFFEDYGKEEEVSSRGVSKSWIYTLNNYTEKEQQLFRDFECSISVFGRERGEVRQTPHLQGYICFKRSYRFAALKKLVPRASWRIAKTTDAMNYCMKELDYEIFDHRVGGGKRTDLSAFTEDLKEMGRQKAVLAHPHIAMKYPSGIKFYEANLYTSRSRFDPPEVRWYYGEAGAGKTRCVYDEFEPEGVTEGSMIYSKTCLKGDYWFDGYHQQKVLLLDELRADSFNWAFLLKLLDRYPLDVQVKNGHMPINSKYIIITSPRKPEETFCNVGEDINQLLRRIHSVRNFVTEVNV